MCTNIGNKRGGDGGGGGGGGAERERERESSLETISMCSLRSLRLVYSFYCFVLKPTQGCYFFFLLPPFLRGVPETVQLVSAAVCVTRHVKLHHTRSKCSATRKREGKNTHTHTH